MQVLREFAAEEKKCLKMTVFLTLLVDVRERIVSSLTTDVTTASLIVILCNCATMIFVYCSTSIRVTVHSYRVK